MAVTKKESFFYDFMADFPHDFNFTLCGFLNFFQDIEKKRNYFGGKRKKSVPIC